MFKTVRSGERALLVNRSGVPFVVDGPQRVFVLTKEFQRLSRFSADQKQYIKLQKRNGTVEHLSGPISLFENPLEVNYARVVESISLDANEVLVVYRRDTEAGVARRIQHGPTVFTPSADEWLHMFIWHGTDPDNKTRKVPKALKFTKLRVIPDQFYLNVDDARTKDDALITVKLMVFFELRDIEQMLNKTNDPIADFINAVQADIIAFTSQLTYEEFMDGSSKLNSLEHYTQLLQNSKEIGYEISKVVFRGYHTSDKLQKLHERAVEKRTALKVQMESEQQLQDLTDSQLLNEQQRSILQQSLQLEQEKHKISLEREQLVHQLKLEETEYMERLSREKAKRLAELQSEKLHQQQVLAHLRQLKALGVELTTYLVNQNPKPNSTLRIVTKGTGAGNIHVHPFK